MLNNPTIGDRVAMFSQWQQKVPDQILIIEKIGKASVWTMDGQRWELRNGGRSGRDKWSACEIRTIADGDEARWESVRRRAEMEREVERIGGIARNLPASRLIAIFAVIQATAPVSATQEPGESAGSLSGKDRT